MTVDAKLKAGDRVVQRMFGSVHHGTLVKVNKVRSIVRIDGRSVDEHAYMGDLRAETAEDVAKRDRDAAMRAWLDREPATRHARVATSSSWGSSDPVGAQVYPVRTPDEMRAAARELDLLADWFAERPAKEQG